MSLNSIFSKGIVLSACVVVSVMSAHGADEVPAQAAIMALKTVDQEDAHRFSLEVTHPDFTDPHGTIAFNCTIISRGRSDDALLRLRIYPEGEELSIFAGELPLSLNPGEYPARFTWTPEAIGDGRYRALIDLVVPDEPDAARAEIAIRTRSAAAVEGELSRLAAEIAELRSHFEGLHATGSALAYGRMRTAILEDAFAEAQIRLGAGNWLGAGQVVDFIDELAQGARARMTFNALASDPITALDVSMADLAIQDGRFFAQGQPCFPFGLLGWVDDAGLAAEARQLGFLHVTVPVAPDTPIGTIDTFLSQAEASNLGVTLLAVPTESATLVSSEWLVDGHVPVTEQSPTSSPWLSELASHIARRPAVTSLSVLQQPQFSYEGEAVRLAFVDYLHQFYPDRDSLNRIWRARLKLFEDASLYESDPRPAFTFDVTTFRMGLANAHISALAGIVNSAAPSRFVQVVRAPDTMAAEPGPIESNPEWVSRVVDINGVSAPAPSAESRYMIDHPSNSIHYALMDSIAQGKPVFAPMLHVAPKTLPDGVSSRMYSHAALWDAVMNGLDGGSAWAWAEDSQLPKDAPGLRNHLERLEGYATAALDVNRLASVLTMMDRAPAEVAILWSISSRIFEDGDPFVESSRRAFEGLAFSGQKVRFISEAQCMAGELDSVRLLVIPQMPALSDAAFQKLDEYVQKGGYIIRSGTTVPYDPRGLSRVDVISYSDRTTLIQGLDDSVSYVHACETAYADGALAEIPRSVNQFGYLLEGVKSRYVNVGGTEYLYLLNIRPDMVRCYLPTHHSKGRDLISGTEISFPYRLEPLRPMLVELNSLEDDVHVAEVVPVKAGAADTKR